MNKNIKVNWKPFFFIAVEIVFCFIIDRVIINAGLIVKHTTKNNKNVKTKVENTNNLLQYVNRKIFSSKIE